MKKRFISDKYEEIKLLGQGTYGKVYKALELNNSDNIVAIKQIEIPSNTEIVHSLKQEGLTNDSITQELENVAKQVAREIEIMESLRNCINIVNIKEHEFLTIETPKSDIKKKFVINIVMELLTPLDETLESNLFTNQDAVKLGKDIAQALMICEDNNILHRDVKIENIFVDQLGNYKLGDFGEAKNIDKTLSNMTRRGTENYMAPEVYKGEEGNKSIDIYSLGIVLYRLFNNKKQPFLDAEKNSFTQSEREEALKKRITGEKIKSPKNADLELSNIILKCIAYRPLDRYSSASSLYEDLKKYKVIAKQQLFSQNNDDKFENELIKKDELTIIRVVELTKKEFIKGCSKKIIIDGKKINVEIPPSDEKDEIVLSKSLLAEYGINNNKKIVLILAKSDNIPKKKNFYYLLIPLIIILLIGIFFFINPFNKSKQDNEKDTEEAKKLTCIVKDISVTNGQFFIYEFYFKKGNNSLDKIYLSANYPPFEEGLTFADLNTLAIEYKNYFCNDKIVDSSSCSTKVLDNNFIELSLQINPRIYLETYRHKRVEGNNLLTDIKNYYENRREDACEEIFTVEEKACSGRYQATCEISEL